MPRKKIQDPNDPMVILAKVALEEQVEKIEEKNRKARSREMALQQMNRTEQAERDRAGRFHRICDHLQGNHRIGVKPLFPRCALHYDQLSSAAVRIYCAKCRFEWRPGDTKESITRYHPEGYEVKSVNTSNTSWLEIRAFLFSFPNANDLISRAFRMERMEPEDPKAEEARLIALMESERQAQIPVA